MPTIRRRPPRTPAAPRTTEPVYSVRHWAHTLGIPLLNFRFAIDTQLALSHLKGADQLNAAQAHLAARIARSVKV